MNEKASSDIKPDISAPFTQDETIMCDIGNTTYRLTLKYKQGATEGLADKLLRIFERCDEDIQ